jgi:hypothetical protein
MIDADFRRSLAGTLLDRIVHEKCAAAAGRGILHAPAEFTGPGTR